MSAVFTISNHKKSIMKNKSKSFKIYKNKYNIFKKKSIKKLIIRTFIKMLFYVELFNKIFAITYND